MDINSVTNVTQTYSQEVTKKSSDDHKGTTSKASFSNTAAVYEKTSANKDSVSVKNSATDRSAIIAQMKADTEARMQQLTDIVRQSMQGQGNALAMTDDIWHYLASGNFENVDEAAIQQAKEDISENGYWGVDQTSSRIVDFAIALSGNDTSKAEELIKAFKKGYDEATSAWGKELPEISSKTYDAVLEKFDQWKNGSYT